MTRSGPPYWAAIWFVIITGTIATAVHLAYGPFPHAATGSRTQSRQRPPQPEGHDRYDHRLATGAAAIAAAGIAMGY
jgi:hypothetical protein